ncbi:Elicitin [Phytophthora megakarya]|uniref:Elicitin n=1 Tax=Phytophthora megakarya TaxID=4795 RepID=A0A225WHG0_9STRA|nr:Elicitin [Phytophthora megakarya]
MNKFFAFVSAVAALINSSDAAACSSAEQQSAYLGMVGLLTGTSLTDCASDSGYNMLYATALPTDDERKAMCGVQACHDLIVAVLATNPPDCDLTIPTSGAVMNVYELASTFETQCDSLNPTTEAPTSAPSEVPTETPTDTPTSAPTNAPTPVTPTSAPTDAPTPVTPTSAPTDAPTPVTPEPSVPGGAC